MIVATVRQIRYIEILANDLEFDREKRNLSIECLLMRPIKALDELSKFEASVVIGKFKEWKESKMRPSKTQIDEFSEEDEIPW